MEREGRRLVKYGVQSVSCIHRMPESLRALFRMVSFTAANTSRMLDVFVACVKLLIHVSHYSLQSYLNGTATAGGRAERQKK